MSNKLNIVEATIGVECSGNGVIDVKACLTALGVSITPSSETDPGFAVDRKRLCEDNCGFDFEEENGIINYTQTGPFKTEVVSITIEVC